MGASQKVVVTSTGGGGGAPTGAAGGDLSGTYPNPTVATSNAHTIVTTADTGTVTSTMILDGTIVAADLGSIPISTFTSGAIANGATATTQAAASNDTKVATDAYVDTGLALKANLASPTFTGTPSLPTGTTGVTQSAGDSSTKLSTTAFVASALAVTPDYMTANPNLINYVGGSAQAGQAILTPVFYEIDAQGFTGMTVAAMQFRIATLLAANTFGLAIYSVSYSSAQTLSATLVCQLNAAGSTAATGVIQGDVTTGAAGSGAAVATLNFTTTKYLVGSIMSEVTTSKYTGMAGTTTNTGMGILRWSAAARASTTDWPASFTQTSVAAANGSTNPPWIALVSTNGKFRF